MKISYYFMKNLNFFNSLSFPLELSKFQWFFLIFFVRLMSSFSQGFLVNRNNLCLYLNSFSYYIALIFMRSNSLLKFTALMDIIGVDYPYCSTHSFELTYVLWSSYYSFPLHLKLKVPFSLVVMSISTLYSSANWLESEIWDMFGIKFFFHPNLSRILSDYGFKGYPLRKDFPLIGFTELRYDDLYKSVVVEPVEMAQGFRIFSFSTPWMNSSQNQNLWMF